MFRRVYASPIRTDKCYLATKFLFQIITNVTSSQSWKRLMWSTYHRHCWKWKSSKKMFEGQTSSISLWNTSFKNSALQLPQKRNCCSPVRNIPVLSNSKSVIRSCAITFQLFALLVFIFCHCNYGCLALQEMMIIVSYNRLSSLLSFRNFGNFFFFSGWLLIALCSSLDYKQGRR